MDEMSNKDLMQAYKGAMALDIEPKSADAKFAMLGLGLEVHTDEEMPKIT